MDFPLPFIVRACSVAAVLTLSTGLATSQTTYNFEDADALNSPGIAGEPAHFEITSAQAHGGTNSVRFADKIVEPYESWTYDLPFDLTSGTISVWFYDARGASAYVPHGSVVGPKWGGSIIIEDKTNPADFGAVEIAELPYGPKYYATEGAVNRGDENSDSFDSNSLPLRSTGFHHVEFHVSPSDTKIFVDGLLADEAAGPGSTGNNLRLRFMYDSPSNAHGGPENWYTAPEVTTRGKYDASGEVPSWIYYDDISIDAELPAAQSHHLDFEVINETADYDTPGASQGPDLPPIMPNDNPNMEDFVNQWSAETSATVAHSGLAAARFANTPAPWKSLEFDLSAVAAGTTISLWFYDSAGQPGSYENVRGNSVIIEEGANPGNFHAVEITTFPFPHGPDPETYYLTVGTAADGGASTLYSRALGVRSVGWHKVEIGIYDTYSEIAVDGQIAKYRASGDADGPIARGPGLDKAPKLRILGDSAGIGRNYTNTSLLYESSRASRQDFAFFDDITIPTESSTVSDWLDY